ncbi:MAG: hypothetical protein AB7P31_00105 [Steroidobacteraceae bacterium]
MIVTPRFVFLHLHRSGGTFVNEGLLRHEPGARQLGYHLPRSLLPDACRRLPVLGLMRSPYRYYASWYAFQSARAQPNMLFRLLGDGGAAGFAATIRRLLTLGVDDALLDRVIAALPAHYTNHGLNLPGPALAAIRGTGLGFYSFLFRHLFGEADDVHVARLEQLRNELPAAMAAAGAPAGAPLLAWLHDAPPRNASAPVDSSAPPDASTGWDPDLAALVAERDAPIIRRFGYASPGPRAAPTSP